MPYQSNADLPDTVRNALPEAAQSRFLEVVNAALDRGLSDSKAFASAWSVVRNGWEKDDDGKWVRKIALRKITYRTLFLSRPLENAADLIAWAKGQGFATTLSPDQIHVTIAYSKEPLEWPEPINDRLIIPAQADRAVMPLGDGGAMVLRFDSPTLQNRWEQLCEMGASWDFPHYRPHVSITWNANGLDATKVIPYAGELIFGPEKAKELDPDWKATVTEKNFQAEVLKVDAEHGVVFGWALISKINGVPYFDVQGDNASEAGILKASVEYMEGERVVKEMHQGDQVGKVIFGFPMTEDIAKAMGIKSQFTGLMIGMKPGAGALAKFKDGTYTGFSMGGRRITDEDVD
jgi:cation transport regulator ChaB